MLKSNHEDYAISDPHISGDGTKPMDVFGGKWVGYLPKIAEDWQKKVDSGDVVVVAATSVGLWTYPRR